MGLSVDQFEFSIGGYPGPYFQLSCLGDVLVCMEQTEGGGTPNIYSINLEGNENWQALLQYLHTRKWKGRYFNEEILDGSHWDFQLNSALFNLSASGSNTYPPGFKKMLRLLNAVTAELKLVIY